MATQNEHGRLIAAAAKAALEPLGCRRRGRSRLWYSDERFWLLSIEFQPSAWSKGTYLNIGVKWLWLLAQGIDLNYRPFDFIPFQSAGQFAPRIDAMAARAGQEVMALRERFKSLHHVYRYLVAQPAHDGRTNYHAAVISGLVGDISTARRFFSELDRSTDEYDWQKKLKSDGAELAAALTDEARFRSVVLSLVNQRRQLSGLPSSPGHLDDEADPTAGP